MGAAGTPTYKPTGSGSGGGGATCATAPELLCLGGRTGTTNNPTISSDSDGIIRGSVDTTKALMLASSAAITPPQIVIQQNGVGLDRVVIGPGSDPTVSFVPSGVFQFLITGDQNITGVPPFIGVWSLNGTFNGGPIFTGISANGSFASPTASVDGDVLAQFEGLGFDSTNALVVNPPGGAISILADGDPIAGVVPGQFLLLSTEISGGGGQAPTRFWIRANGNIGIGDDMHDPAARFHIRNEADATIASIFMGHDAQTANLTDWDTKVVVQLAANANPGDATLTFLDSTKLYPSGTIYMNHAHPIYRFRAYDYTANNTGTGVLTLVGTVATLITTGGSIGSYQPHVVTSIDPSGNLLFTGGDATGAHGYIEMGQFNTTNDPAAPATGFVRIYARDNGAGKTQVMARFATGAVQQMAIQP